MTNTWADIKNTNLVVIMGGNAAEAHPCGFKWVTEAKAHNKAKLIVVDPRFTRTAAVADIGAGLGHRQRNGAADALGRGQLVHAGGLQPAQAAEAGKQLLAALGADTRDILQRRAAASLAAAGAMPLDGETVRFVADLLDQVQTRVIRSRCKRIDAARHEQLLLSRPARFPFGDRGQCHVAQSEFREDVDGHRQLSLAAVDQDEIRHLAFARDELPVAAGERVTQRGVIISWNDAGAMNGAPRPFDRAGVKRRLTVRLDP